MPLLEKWKNSLDKKLKYLCSSYRPLESLWHNKFVSIVDFEQINVSFVVEKLETIMQGVP